MGGERLGRLPITTATAERIDRPRRAKYDRDAGQRARWIAVSGSRCSRDDNELTETKVG